MSEDEVHAHVVPRCRDVLGLKIELTKHHRLPPGECPGLVTFKIQVSGVCLRTSVRLRVVILDVVVFF